MDGWERITGKYDPLDGATVILKLLHCIYSHILLKCVLVQFYIYFNI